MDLVVDANIIFAVLIKDSFTYEIIFKNKFHLFTPEYIFKEIEKHKEELLEKTDRTPEEFHRLLEILQRKINIVPLEELTKYIEEAEKISPDPDDMTYFALALKLNCPIWTNEKKLKEKQNIVKIYHTHDLANL